MKFSGCRQTRGTSVPECAFTCSSRWYETRYGVFSVSPCTNSRPLDQIRQPYATDVTPCVTLDGLCDRSNPPPSTCISCACSVETFLPPLSPVLHPSPPRFVLHVVHHRWPCRNRIYFQFQPSRPSSASTSKMRVCVQSFCF